MKDLQIDFHFSLLQTYELYPHQFHQFHESHNIHRRISYALISYFQFPNILKVPSKIDNGEGTFIIAAELENNPYFKGSYKKIPSNWEGMINYKCIFRINWFF